MRYKIRPYSLAWLMKILKDNFAGGLIGAALFIGMYFCVCLIGGVL